MMDLIEVIPLYSLAKKNKRKYCIMLTKEHNKLFPQDTDIPLIVKWHRVTRHIQIEKLKDAKKKIPPRLQDNYTKACSCRNLDDLILMGLEQSRS